MAISLESLRLFSDNSPKPVVAISACLYGEAVRYDGADKSLQSTLDILAKHLELKPICPEVGAGLGVPRPPVQLVRDTSGELRALGRDDAGLDVTEALVDFAGHSLRHSPSALTGYILKSRSPSCGLNSTPLFNSDGEQVDRGSGIQAALFNTQRPWLQFIEDTGLSSAAECERYILRCRILHDVRLSLAHAAPTQLRQHYAELIARLSPAIQQQLTTDNSTAFWQGLGRGLGELDQR